MKNFPHQINKIPKLVGALEVYKGLIQENANVNDDGVFGYALAEALIYTFRNQQDTSPESIKQRIIAEQVKPKGNQGPRTAARDIRRFFELAKFIDEGGLTEIGQNIIASGKDVSNEKVRNLWHDAMVELELSSYTNPAIVSHPYVIMLKLLRCCPKISTSKLALALEAEDDSPDEFARVLGIALSDDWTSQIESSESMLRNAVKILPGIAKQIGDMDPDGHASQKRIIKTPPIQRINDEKVEDVEENIEIQQSILSSQLPSYTGKPKAKAKETVQGSRRLYPRDRSVVINALKFAGYQCEVDPSHPTFIRKSDNLPYTESHHLIPLSYSDSFDVSLDVEENVVSLCSNCHNTIHYGKEASKLISFLYEKRKAMLAQVGLEISIEELTKMY